MILILCARAGNTEHVESSTGTQISNGHVAMTKSTAESPCGSIASTSGLHAPLYPSASGTRMSTGGDALSAIIASRNFQDLACSAASVSAFIGAVCRHMFPLMEVWGSRRNWNLFLSGKYIILLYFKMIVLEITSISFVHHICMI